MLKKNYGAPTNLFFISIYKKTNIRVISKYLHTYNLTWSLLIFLCKGTFLILSSLPIFSTEFTHQYDMALLKLPYRINVNRFVNVVCLPDSSLTFTPGQNCITAGWGLTDAGGKLYNIC